MTIVLQKQPGMRILELGGGANRHAQADVNVDVRSCFDAAGRPTVDFTVDFNEFPWPIGSDDFDGLISIFALEHISYRNVPNFLKEAIRIIKPGTKAMFVIPNTEAQLHWIQANPGGWDNKDMFNSASEILFGSQDYKENSHASYFSPAIIADLMGKAGFVDIRVTPYGPRQTDMCVEGSKPSPQHAVGILTNGSPGAIAYQVCGAKNPNTGSTCGLTRGHQGKHQSF
jgi:hypothetical protein